MSDEGRGFDWKLNWEFYRSGALKCVDLSRRAAYVSVRRSGHCLWVHGMAFSRGFSSRHAVIEEK